MANSSTKSSGTDFSAISLKVPSTFSLNILTIRMSCYTSFLSLVCNTTCNYSHIPPPSPNPPFFPYPFLAICYQPGPHDQENRMPRFLARSLVHPLSIESFHAPEMLQYAGPRGLYLHLETLPTPPRPQSSVYKIGMI